MKRYYRYVYYHPYHADSGLHVVITAPNRQSADYDYKAFFPELPWNICKKYYIEKHLQK